MDALHISKARAMLDRGLPVALGYVKKNGERIMIRQAVSLRYDLYKGTRTIKSLASRKIMAIRDVLIVSINDIDVFL